MTKKINELQLQINDCNKRIENLMIKYDFFSYEDKKEIEYLKNKIKEAELEINKIRENVTSSNIQVNNIKKTYEKPVQKTTVKQEKIKDKKRKEDLENFIGKSLMGILASILIFLSLIFFSILIIPSLGNVAKISLMYIFSIGLTIFGVNKLKTNYKNKTFISLTGCGLGTVYISLILSRVYFEIFNDILLFVMLFIWGILIVLITKTRHIIFEIIRQTGISISIILGICLCIGEKDAEKILFLLIYLILSEIIFNIILKFKNSKEIFISNNYFFIFNILLIIVSNKILLTSTNNIFLLLTSILSFISIVLLIIKSINSYSNENISIKNNYIIQIILLSLELIILNSSSLIITIISYILIVLYIEIKNKYNNFDFSLIYYIYFFIISLYVLALNNLADFISNKIGLTPIFIILFLIWKINNNIKDLPYEESKKKYFLNISNIMAIFTLFNIWMNEFSYLICGIISLLTIIKIMEIKNIKKIHNSKIYVIAMILITINIYRLLSLLNIDNIIVFYIILECLFCINFIVRQKTTYTNEISTKTFDFINGILMSSCFLLFETNDIQFYSLIFHLLLCFLLIRTFTFNTINLLKKGEEKKLYSFYVGIKDTFAFVIILSSFGAEGIIVSILCFSLAIIYIVFGFVKEFKNLRIFGLILSLISIVKLILIDISYTGLISRAIGFFICGILCFIINYIYNKINENINS